MAVNVKKVSLFIALTYGLTYLLPFARISGRFGEFARDLFIQVGW